MARIFLCHASEDKTPVRDVYQRLGAIEGFEPWLDEEDLLPGQDWAYEIPLALQASDCILIFFSSTSVAKRGYLQREMKLALDALAEIPAGEIFAVPVRLDECEVPEPFRRYHYANLFDPRGFDRLVTALHHGLEQRGEQVPELLETPPANPEPTTMPPAIEDETQPPPPEPEPIAPSATRAQPSKKRPRPPSLWRNPTIIAALITAIAMIIAATIPEVRTFIAHTLGTGTDQRTPLPIGYAAFFAQRRLAVITEGRFLQDKLISGLEGAGSEIRPFAPNQLQELDVFQPDLVLVSETTERAWQQMSATILRKLFHRQKIVGLGSGGAELFQKLGTNIGRGSVMHSPGNYSVEVVNFPTGNVPRPSIPEVLRVYEGRRADAIGVYDEGAPSLAGFEAIARWPRSEHHWPVARQGNLLLWGFDAPLETLTDDGQHLLLAMLADHLQRPFVSYQDVESSVSYVQPGPIDERLTSQFPGHIWHFRVGQPGAIKAELTWASTQEDLTLILNGPGQVGYYARKDGRSPLQIDFEVTPDLLSLGDEWRLSVKKFGGVSEAIDYRIALDFPE